MIIPFYLEYSDFANYVSTNFPNLYINDSIMFLTYVIINIAFIFLLIEMLKLIKGLFLWFKSFIF